VINKNAPIYAREEQILAISMFVLEGYVKNIYKELKMKTLKTPSARGGMNSNSCL